jgi:hypothetical protein
MSAKRWNYVDVNCISCNKAGKIRIDQYNRKNKQWECRSCSYKGRKNELENPSPRHDPIKVGAWKSYYNAKERCRTGKNGYYKDIEFRFKSFDEMYDEIGPRPEGKSLDRINNLGHYEPGNVHWATQAEQNYNKRKKGTALEKHEVE